MALDRCEHCGLTWPEGSHAESDCVVFLRAEIERLRAQIDADNKRNLHIACDNLRLIHDNQELRVDLVWAVNHCAGLIGGGKLVTDNYEHEVYCDGTPDSICRAVREARDGL